MKTFSNFIAIAMLLLLFLVGMDSGLLADELPKPRVTPPEAIHVPEGFRAELVYPVPREQQGSWVSLTVDDQGRIIASDQGGSLYRISPAPLGASWSETQVEKIDLNIGQAHGLLYAFDSLYVMVNGNAAQGSFP